MLGKHLLRCICHGIFQARILEWAAISHSRVSLDRRLKWKDKLKGEWQSHSFTHSFIHPPIHSVIHPPIHSFIHSLIHPSIHPYTHPFFHSGIKHWPRCFKSKNKLEIIMNWLGTRALEWTDMVDSIICYWGNPWQETQAPMPQFR